MPAGFEDYIAHFHEAQAAWKKLYAALQDLSAKIGQANKNPSALGQSSSAWPTRQDLREMLQEAEKKSAPLMAEYSKLSPEVKIYAPQPSAAAQRN